MWIDVSPLARRTAARVDQALLDRYAKHLRGGDRRPVINAQLLQVIFDLQAYRDHLPTLGLTFAPWPGRSASMVAGYVFSGPGTARRAFPRRSWPRCSPGRFVMSNGSPRS